MNSTHDLIKSEIEDAKLKIENLELKLKSVKDEPSQKDCPQCHTKNYHYYPNHDSWCCAFC